MTMSMPARLTGGVDTHLDVGVAAALDEWYRKLRPHGIDYQIVDTDQPLSTALRAYLRKRERLG